MAEKILTNTGVKVLLDPIPHVRSTCMGIWVGAGSRLEGPSHRGAFHFIEHMLFKGTRRRSAQQIAVEIDSVGGVLNGFTSREYSSFYVKVMDEHLPLAVDLLTDIYTQSTFEEGELERERDVILQEIKMVDDTPEEQALDLFHKSFWRGSSMAHPIQGEMESVSNLKRDDLLEFFRRFYHHREVVVSVSGRFDREFLLEALEERLEPLRGDPQWPAQSTPDPHSGISLVHKDLEQVNVCIGTTAPSARDPDRYVYYILSTILGGGMSSMLFQEVREKRGLAYTVYSFLSPYRDTGVLLINLSTSEDKLCEALEVTLSQMEHMAQAPPSEDQLRIARDQIKGGIILGLESPDRRMARMAKNELYYGRDVSLEEVIQSLEEVTADQVLKAAQRSFDLERINALILGPATGKSLPKRLRALLG
jgi:predicted Zn-dependent peptidase